MRLFDFLQTKKAPVSRTPLICHKMAHYTLPYALFQQLTPTVHVWIDGTMGYQLFRYVAEIEVGDPATREGSYAAIEAFRCFPTETQMMSATAVYLSLKYPETAQVGLDAVAARGMSATPLLLGPLYSIATVVNSSVEQTRYYIVEKTTGGQTRLLQVDKFGREFDLGLGPAPIPSLI